MNRVLTKGAAVAIVGVALAPAAGQAAGPEPLWVPDPELPAEARQEPAPAPTPELVRSIALIPDADPSKVAVAHWMARLAEAAGLPGELPVMAALVESGLRNLPYGDADSVGFFQMRMSIWNRGAYEGYFSRTELQMQWFIDRALRVRDARRGAGDEDFGVDSGDWGEWIADVENPLGIYRGRYALRLAEASALLAQGAPDTSALETTAFGRGRALTLPPDPASAELIERVLTQPDIAIDEAGRIDLEAGRVDARVMTLMLEAAARTPIVVSVIQTGHAFHTVNGSPSNHSFGRAIDVASVGGARVDASNGAARKLALELSALPTSIRPTEIGTPWAIDAPAFFTDADHQDHLHLGYDDPGTVIPRGEVREAADRREDADRRVRRAGGPARVTSEPSFDAADGTTDRDPAAPRDPAEPRFQVGA